MTKRLQNPPLPSVPPSVVMARAERLRQLHDAGVPNAHELCKDAQATRKALRLYRPPRPRPVAPPAPQTDVQDTRRRNPMFDGRCYLCGARISLEKLFCHSHKWAGE